MDKLKPWVLLTVAACLVVLAAGWFLLVSPQRAEADDLRAQTATQEAGNAAELTRLAALKAQAKDLPKQQAKLAAVQAKIPADPAMPTLIRALNAASADAGVTLVGITPSAPVAASAAPAPAPVDPADPAAAAAPAAPAASALTRIPLTLDVVGSYFEIQQFVSSVEGLDRALRISGLSLAEATDANAAGPRAAPGSRLAAAITGEVFLTPSAPAPATPAPAAAPATTPAAN